MRTIQFALPVALLALMGCAPSAPPAPPAPPAPGAATAAGQPESALGRTVSNAMEKARQEMATKNIEINGGIRFRHGDKGVTVFSNDGSDDARPKAEITPKGDLLIAGSPVAINESQRNLLLEYRGEVIGIANAGMDIGVQGADMASKAVHAAIDNIFSLGKSEPIDQKMEAEGERMKAKARELCSRMPPMLATQQKLAANLPQFKPYATMNQSDIDDCMKDDDHDNADREQIRQNIRQGIRNGVQAAVRGDSGNDAASEADSAATH